MPMEPFGLVFAKARLQTLLSALIFCVSMAEVRAQVRELASPRDQETGIFGTSVAGLPDVDGDGYGDVVVGAPGERDDPFGRESRGFRPRLSRRQKEAIRTNRKRNKNDG